MHHTGVQQPHTFRWSRPHRRALPDLLLLPAAYAVHAQCWPLLLFSMARGNGAGSAAGEAPWRGQHRRGAAEFPFVVLAAMPPRRPGPEPLLALLDAIAQHYDVDPERCSVTGLVWAASAWAIALAAPHFLPRLRPSVAAAILPVSAPSGTSRCRPSMGCAIPLSRCNDPWRWSRLTTVWGERPHGLSEAGHDAWTATYAPPSCTPGSSRTHEGRAPRQATARAEPRTA